MDCPACAHPNLPDSRFCGSCGASLLASARCAACGTENPGGQRFCNACGHELVTPAAAPAGLPEHLARKIRDSHITEGERKHVTVMFVDVMGSMDLAEQEDPEAWRVVMERFVEILCDGVHRFEGTVDKFTGDGIMALFGAPIAHEDHAQRACFCALHLQKDLAVYAGDLRREHGLNFSVRIGMNSGEVVVGTIGEDLDMTYTAIGHTVGLAQRMEQLAEPGATYLTARTAQLVQGYVELRDLGEFRIKGSSHPLGVHRLIGIGAARGRLDVSRQRGFSKFVGREEEMRVLQNAWEQSLAGRPQVIGIVGEAGVGKSRLCDMFMRRCRAQGVPIYHTTGLAHAASTPLVPVLHIMRAYFDVTDLDSDQTARERIAGKLLLLDKRFADDLPLMFDFLGVPDPERPAPRMDPEARQRRLLDVIKRLVRAQGARAPGLSVFEDLHWFDPGSELFVATQLEAAQGGHGMTILNFRPEYHAPWMAKSYYRQMALEPLGPEAIEHLLADLLGSDPSLDGIGEVIRERTGGNPFFIEEVVQSLVESGTLEGGRASHRLVRPIDDTSVPASVQAVLAARIDRLGDRDKAVLQAAAVIGKEFPEPVLARVADLDRTALEESLEHLASGEYIYEQELYPEAVYAFKHPLTQEVAYGSQLGARRAEVHAAVARAMEAEHPDRLDEWAGLLAQHWELAGEALEAAHWHARAGAWAGANDPTAALEHWRRVRELTDAVPESAETLKLGLSARIFALGYGWRLGMSDEEIDALSDEADSMAARTQDIWSRSLLLSQLATITNVVRGRCRDAVAPVRESIRLAEESGDAALYVTAAGNTYVFFLLGDYHEALTIIDRAIELADGDPSVGADLSVQCPLAQVLLQKGALYCELGRLDEAGQLIERGRRMAAERHASELVAWSHCWGVWHAYRCGDGERAMAHARSALELTNRIGDAFARTWAGTLVAVAAAMQGRWQESLDAVELARAVSPERRVAADAEGWRLLATAEAHLNLGDSERAIDVCREAVRLTQERGFAAESVARIALARTLLSAGSRAREEVESSLARADELVRTMGTVVLEPVIREQRAELARQAGDARSCERHMREAHRRFVQMGATGHAERLEGELAAFAT